MTGSDLTRRQLLKTGAALGGAAAAYGPLGGLLQSAAAAGSPACPSGLKDIEHIVIVMQENRPFDQFFGTFPGVRGFADRTNHQAFFQPGYRGRGSRNGHLIPFHLDGRRPTGQCIGSIEKPNHDWIPQHRSWNRGRNNLFYRVHGLEGWDGNQGHNVMGYFTQSDIPYYWALARQYTLCDMYFSSVIGPTEPNRLYSVSATLDPDGQHGGPCLATHFNVFYGLSGPGPKYFGKPWVYRWTTMAEQLEARGISWKSYTQPLALTNGKLIVSGNLDSPFSAFARFRTGRLNQLGIQPTYPSDFLDDLDRGQLPAVSWIQVNFNYSEHPNFAPARGEYAVDHVLRAIWAHPDIWRKTAVIINHDENGGFFDHVAPPTAPPGTKGEYLTIKRLPVQAGGIRGPIGLGFRVPCIVVSPWTRGGFVCSDTFDHTSVLRLIERRFGAEVPNVSKWRRSVTGDMTSAFNFAAPDYSIPSLPATSLNSPRVNSALCDFHGETGGSPYPLPRHIPFPRQQPGRPRRPSGVC